MKERTGGWCKTDVQMLGLGMASRGLDRIATLIKRLLVADDEPIIREVLRTYLEGFGFTVDLAEDGEEAWRKVQSYTHDGIVLDLNMPGMSGTEVYRLIKASNKSLAKRVVFITGGALTLETQALISATGNPVLLKPFDMEELHQQVLGLL